MRRFGFSLPGPTACRARQDSNHKQQSKDDAGEPHRSRKRIFWNRRYSSDPDHQREQYQPAKHLSSPHQSFLLSFRATGVPANNGQCFNRMDEPSGAESAILAEFELGFSEYNTVFLPRNVTVPGDVRRKRSSKTLRRRVAPHHHRPVAFLNPSRPFFHSRAGRTAGAQQPDSDCGL